MDNQQHEYLMRNYLQKNRIQKYLIDHKVFGQILQGIGPIPFAIIKMEEYFLARREDELYDEKENKYRTPHVTDEEKYYYVSQRVAAVARECGSDIAIINNNIYFYNSIHWEKIPDTYVAEFMALASIKAGMLRAEASRKKAKQALYDQLKSDHNALEQSYSNKTVKINLQNGTLVYDGEKFVLKNHDASDMFRYALGYEYDKDATSPLFDKFLDEVLPEKEAQDFLMEFLGYCFIPTLLLKLEMCLLLYGPGRNGKGVIYELTRELLGRDYVSGYSMSALSYDANTRAQISDMLANYSSELGGRCNGDVLKKLISGEGVEVKNLYKDVYTMNDYQCKFIFNCNKLPQGSDIDQALARRLGILEFNVIIPLEKVDVHLPDKLKTELSGIFNRVLSGACRLLKNKCFTKSPMMERTNQSFKEKTDTVLQFINAENWKPTCDLENGERLNRSIQHVQLKELFSEYLHFCKESNSAATNRRTFAERIRQHFYVQASCTRNETWVFAKKEGIPVPDINEFKTSSDNILDQVLTELNPENNENSNG